ncbi:MAG: WYL domain-containing protein [Homoserinimonas sp.]
MTDKSGAALRVPVEERLFSLVLALLATETGLTKHEILSTVQGYRQRYNNSGDNANLERQFERDKDDIRELGVPLETIDDPSQSGNNQNLRYRIPRGSYELPTDITFSAEETTLLNLAAMVWREGSLSDESRRALLKLRSLGLQADQPVLSYAARNRVRESTFEPLNTALERNSTVSFSYLKPGEAHARKRTADPHALIQHQGRWHLYAMQDGVPKTFLLRRITSPVTQTGKTFSPPPGDQAEVALRELEALWNSRSATVQVVPGSDAATRLLKRRGTEADGSTLTLHYADANILADELTGYGPEVLVVAPPELREAVRERLEQTTDQHIGDHREEAHRG